MIRKAIVFVFLLALIGAVSAATLSFSQFGTNATVDGNPLGGGTGYSDIKTSGDCTATTSATLVSCLAGATSGQVVYVPETAEINMTGIYDTPIPPGVILASNRGSSGSSGGKIFQKSEAINLAIIHQMFSVNGSGVRITGLRLEGYDKTRAAYAIGTTAVSNYNYSGFVVDNCEVSGWQYAGIHIKLTNDTLTAQGLADTELGSSIAYIHHNFIHHNQANGAGYGVEVNNATALVKANLFSYNRHAITSSGVPGSGYEASYNLQNAGEGLDNHVFDIHGYPETDGSAGTLFRYYHNTILSSDSLDINIRGVPLQDVSISYNIFTNITGGGSVYQHGTGNVTMSRNAINGGYFAGDAVTHHV